MDGWFLDGQMDKCINQIDGWINRWIDGWMNVAEIRLAGQMDKWIDEGMYELMYGALTNDMLDG